MKYMIYNGFCMRLFILSLNVFHCFILSLLCTFSLLKTIKTIFLIWVYLTESGLWAWHLCACFVLGWLSVLSSYSNESAESSGSGCVSGFRARLLIVRSCTTTYLPETKICWEHQCCTDQGDITGMKTLNTGFTNLYLMWYKLQLFFFFTFRLDLKTDMIKTDKGIEWLYVFV